MYLLTVAIGTYAATALNLIVAAAFPNNLWVAGAARAPQGAGRGGGRKRERSGRRRALDCALAQRKLQRAALLALIACHWGPTGLQASLRQPPACHRAPAGAFHWCQRPHALTPPIFPSPDRLRRQPHLWAL